MRRLERVGEMPGYERFIDTITRETQKINRHLPKSRKTLEILLQEDEPKVESMDGNDILLKKADLERAAVEASPDQRKALRLPLILVRRLELGRGAFVVLGGKTERLFVRKALGMLTRVSDYGSASEDELVLYYVQVQELLNKFRSLVAIGFGIPDDFASD